MQHAAAIVDKAGLAQADLTQILSDALSLQASPSGSPVHRGNDKIGVSE